jgi:CBS domain-containing protein
VAGDLIYAYRVMQLPLLDADGAIIGRLADIVLAPGPAGNPPIVLGFVATAQRRRIFVNAARVVSLDADGARLRSWDLDLAPFHRRSGELLVSKDLLDRRLGDETVSDLALRPAPGKASAWEVAKVRLGRRSPLRRRQSFRVVDWDEVMPIFATNEVAAEVARLRDMHPSDVAHLVRNLPLSQRTQIAEAMEDERLADLLEELTEAEQLRLIEGLDLQRLVDVLEEMEYDDAADLLAEMPGEQRTRVLDAMDADDAGTLRRLLSYGEGTAGGLMNPDVIIVGPTSTVAEALARIREPDWLVSVAAQVFVTQPPWVPPTGRYLGVVHFQRLLREAPGLELAHCLVQQPSVPPDTPEREVAERLAAYNLLALPVCDEAQRLLGAITVDDVLDRALPAGWRQRQRVPSTVRSGRSP